MPKTKLTDTQILKYIVSLLKTFPLEKDEAINGAHAVDALQQIWDLIIENE